MSSRDLFPGPIGLTVQFAIEVFPFRVDAFKLPDLPGAGPFLHRLFTLNGALNPLMRFGVDEPCDVVFLHERGAASLTMLMDATGQIIGHADVEGSVFAAGKDVNPVSRQFALTLMDPGNKSRDDNRWSVQN